MMAERPEVDESDATTDGGSAQQGVEPQFVIQVLQEQLQNSMNVQIMLAATLRQQEARFEQQRALWFAERQSLLARDSGNDSS